MSLRELFTPKSIALIGATDRSRWSQFTHQNLRDFDGPVYRINPHGGTVHGGPAYRSVAEVPGPVDLAYVMVPTKAVLPVLRECAAAGVRAAAVLTAGFAEVGEEGRRLQDEVVALAREHDLTVLGPNGNGYINAAAGIVPYGLPIPGPVPRGPVGFVLQSGALVSGVLGAAAARNVGTSLLVSMGNEAAVTVADVVDHMVDDPGTRVIALFLESVRDPEAFRRAAERALAAGKPIVALKVGRSKIGARSAAAHTGALVGDDRVTDAAFHRLGVVRVRSLEDLIATAGLLAATGPLPGGRVGVVTPSGGACEIIADRAEDEGVQLPEFAERTLAELRELCPPFATVQNPLDVTGYVLLDPTLLVRALQVVAADPGVDVTVLLADLPRRRPADEAAEALVRGRVSALADVVRSTTEATGRPIVVMSTTMSEISEYGRELVEQTGHPHVLGGIEHGLTALGNALTWSAHHRRAPAPAAAPVEAVPADPDRDPLELLADAGVPVVPTLRVAGAEEAVAAAESAGYPVVVKVDGDIPHKTDIGGVRLGLRTAAEVREAYAAVVAAGGEAATGAVVQPQREDGVELIAGVVRDPTWGLVLAVGLGGIWTEVMRDSVLRLLPVHRAEIKEMIGGLRGAPLLRGARGRRPADLDRLAEAIEAFAARAEALGERLESIEINPVLVDGPRVEALDALVTWRPASEED
ncbi:acetate--CoA ligase family protein [Actinomadura sp. WMMB 499]|uniref:acetate--CoA ligase family protein n=1 Tax=Actinomadura sp. WMMB 499 TaxID=1219491 RepID=UPI00124603E7|nr:acetate--CoA ligase [Actinomadura sp. WMMB 499]QFG21644.1 CoA-binding protein [Actinomadura sp. WMMB 499]